MPIGRSAFRGRRVIKNVYINDDEESDGSTSSITSGT